jgi:hypothetical protein
MDKTIQNIPSISIPYEKALRTDGDFCHGWDTEIAQNIDVCRNIMT